MAAAALRGGLREDDGNHWTPQMRTGACRIKSQTGKWYTIFQLGYGKNISWLGVVNGNTAKLSKSQISKARVSSDIPEIDNEKKILEDGRLTQNQTQP